MINMTREVGGKPVREQYTLGFLGYNSDESMYMAYGVGTNVDGLNKQHPQGCLRIITEVV